MATFTVQEKKCPELCPGCKFVVVFVVVQWKSLSDGQIYCPWKKCPEFCPGCKFAVVQWKSVSDCRRWPKVLFVLIVKWQVPTNFIWNKVRFGKKKPRFTPKKKKYDTNVLIRASWFQIWTRKKKVWSAPGEIWTLDPWFTRPVL